MNNSIKIIVSILIISTLLVSSLSVWGNAENEVFSLKTEEKSDASLTPRQIADKCRTSIVAIETETKVVYNNNNYYDPFGGLFGFGYGYGYGYGDNGRQPREYTQKAAGSGIILSEDGYILTNNHVISGADNITIYVLNGDDNDSEETYEATLIGTSESNDIAILKIDAKGLNAAVFGDSDTISFGDQAIVIGNPLGKVHGSVTSGIISHKAREITIDDVTINAIQTDAPVNSGNSGGALFDDNGNVVGIIYAKTSSALAEGIGYAIPTNAVKQLINTIINDPDSVKDQTLGSQIMLGITIRDVTKDISEQYNMPIGVYITEVSSMSAAERCGLQRGDIITSFDNEPVTSADDLNAIKSKQKPGNIVEIVVDRNGNQMTLSIVIPQPTDIPTK
jgi:serine protease Do